MPSAYAIGRTAALSDTGLLKTAAPAPIAMRQRKDPFQELHNKLKSVFKVKMPKFDMAAHMKRLLGNPLKQPQLHLGGKGPTMVV